jgi:transcriptional regulator with XRE-family HTH domain
MIRKHREAKGMTQEQVAQKAGVTKQYITMLEAGKRESPSLPVLRRLAKALGVPVRELLG